MSEQVVEKEGYELREDERESGLFHARKLARVTVSVRDENDEAVPGAVLSLSSEHGYRNNSATRADGTFTFWDLAPGTYFLRVLLKEYSFDPTTAVRPSPSPPLPSPPPIRRLPTSPCSTPSSYSAALRTSRPSLSPSAERRGAGGQRGACDRARAADCVQLLWTAAVALRRSGAGPRRGGGGPAGRVRGGRQRLGGRFPPPRPGSGAHVHHPRQGSG
jgi:hypothetical protein